MSLPDDAIVDTAAADDEPPTRRIRLGTTDEISVEIARVYRDMRAKRIKAEDGTRLAWVLHTLAKVKEAELERRLEEMERLLAPGRTGR